MAELPDIAAMGAAGLRLSPQRCNMVAVTQVYDDVLSARLDGEAGVARLAQIYPQVPFANRFYHGATGADWIGGGKSQLR